MHRYSEGQYISNAVAGTFAMAKISLLVRKQPVLRELRGNYVDNKFYDLNIPF